MRGSFGHSGQRCTAMLRVWSIVIGMDAGRRCDGGWRGKGGLRSCWGFGSGNVIMGGRS